MTIYTDLNSKQDRYPHFEEVVRSFFNKAISGGKKLFRVGVEDLNELYLSNLPEYARQHYTCTACRHFINRYGGLVTIDEDGTMQSAIWDVDNTPDFFKASVKAMREAVLNSDIVSVFLPDEKRLGTPKTGEWTHLSCELPKEMTNRSLLQNAHQAMAEKIQHFGMLQRAIDEISLDTVEKALTLIQTPGTLYRGETYRANAKWFKEVLVKYNAIKESNRRNFIWLVVANSSAGFIGIRGNTLGTLLSDIAEGMSTALIAARFKEKMDPQNRMRSQSGPSAAAILEAERTVEKLGIRNSLAREYVTSLDQLPEEEIIWKDRYQPKPESETVGGVFGHIEPKQKAPKADDKMTIPAQTMTWEKFQRTVLAEAQKIEALTDNANRFMAMVTAADPMAPNILLWDNVVSWYYHGGIDGDLQRRVEEAGGKYTNNEIRATLAWEGGTDLDFHCMTPDGFHINFSDKRDRRGGYLDVDANGGRVTSLKPVENIRWANNAPEGIYKFWVHNYQQRGTVNPTPYMVELEIAGQVYTVHSEATGTGYRSQNVFEFEYKKGQPVRFLGQGHIGSSAWGVQPASFAKVNVIIPSPNLWGDEPKPSAGNHVFFLLEGIKDEAEGKGRGFFNETLKSELRPIRRTLEAFTGNTPIAKADEAVACGLGFTNENDWNLTLRVTTKDSVRMIKIDRWD